MKPFRMRQVVVFIMLVIALTGCGTFKKSGGSTCACSSYR